MDSKVVVTYKRKRLFSRSDHPLVNLNSDTSSESAKSKASDSFPKQEGTIAVCTLQNNDTGFGIYHAYSKDNVGEDVQKCENRNSHWCNQCSEKHAVKPKMLYSCSEQKKSSVSDETQKLTLEQKCCPKSNMEQIISQPKVILDGSPKLRYKVDSAGQSNDEENIVSTRSKLSFVKMGSEYEDNCGKILTLPELSDACCGAEKDPKSLKTSGGINHICQIKGTCTPETSTLEETDKLNRDKYNTLDDNSGVKRKLTSALITFCRRSKRNKADNASKSEKLTTASCLVDLNEKVELSNPVGGYEEKDIPKDIDNSCSFSAPAPATSTVVLVDNPHHFLYEDAPNAAAQCSQEHTIQQKVCIDVQDNDRINTTTQRLSNEDVKSRKMHCDISEKGNYLPHVDLFVPPRASHNFDCNAPPDGASDENQPIETSEVVHDSLGSASKIKEDMLTFPENVSPVRAVRDKGKRILNSPPALTCDSSKNNYIQFLPESQTDSVLNITNNSEKGNMLVPSSLHSSTTIGLSMQPEQMVDGRAYFPPSYEWPNFQVQPRESLLSLNMSSSDRTQSFSRDKMMLDNILTRARAVRGNRNSFLDKFEYPTTWLEEELDSLWIGVRRHGRGNWDAILGDRRLHFLPWKSPWDLAERWQVEQPRLLSSMPVSQKRYISPPDILSEHASNLHHSRVEGYMNEVQLSLGQSYHVQKGVPLHFKNNKMNKELQKAVTTEGTATAIVGDESSSTAALINGSLPHWLRTAAAEIPAGPSRLTRTIPSVIDHTTFNCPGTSHQPWLSNRCIFTQREPEPLKEGMFPCSESPLVIEGGKAQSDECSPNKKKDLIFISDVSSEETISDDRSRLS